MFWCGLRRRSAWISRKLFTWSSESKWFFMHLMATYLPFFMHCAWSQGHSRYCAPRHMTPFKTNTAPSQRHIIPHTAPSQRPHSTVTASS